MKTRTLLALSLALAALPSPAPAAERTWTGAGSPEWTDPANWDALPAPGDALVFAGSANSENTNNFPAGTAFGGLRFDPIAAAGITLTGNAITLDGGISFTEAPGNKKPVFTINLPIIIKDNRWFSVPMDATLVVNGAISGGNDCGLTKSGVGRLSLFSKESTFGGKVLIADNAITVSRLADAGSPSSLGTGSGDPVIRIGKDDSGGILDLAGIPDLASASSTNRQIQIGGGKPNTTGGTQIRNFSDDPDVTLTFSNPEFNAPVKAKTPRALHLGGDNPGDNTIAGSIRDNQSAAISVTKKDTGKWVLSGTNTYSGPTSVTGGTLAIKGGDALPDDGTLTLDGGILEVLEDESVDTLLFGTARQPAGNYGSSQSPAKTKDDSRFAGTGTLTVTSGP